ncbi:MAG: aminoglycoside phosphotransferase family protein [Pseudomonadales bacterium]
MQDRAFAWTRATLQSDQLIFQPLKAEASFRAFYRVECPAGACGKATSVVLMVSPPEKEQNAQFERLARVFADSALPVPEILHSNPTAGWYLLSDVGRHDLAAAYGTAHEDAALERAIDALVRLQRVDSPAIPPYTAQRFEDELGIFSEWFASTLLDTRLPEAVGGVFRQLVDRTRGQHQCCVHRDYHCRNLLYDPASGGFGIVDFQDALVGPVSYDLASLLHDCYHEFPEEGVARWVDVYLSRTRLALDDEAFREDVDHMAVQRQLKAVGIFARLRLRDDRTTHLVHIPPVLEHLRRLTRRYPGLAPLADWLDGLDRAEVADRLAALAGPPSTTTS